MGSDFVVGLSGGERKEHRLQKSSFLIAPYSAGITVLEVLTAQMPYLPYGCRIAEIVSSCDWVIGDCEFVSSFTG